MMRGLVLGGLFLTTLLSACREPTELTLKIRTNVPCASAESAWRGVAVYVGAPGEDLEHASATLTATACDATGRVGSLVIVPSGSKTDEVGLRVVAGLERGPEECEAHDYQGCIVARRALRFTPHASLDLEVELDADCESIGCDADHTCRGGTCLDAAVAAVVPTKPPTAPTGHTVHCGSNGALCGTTGDVCCLHVIDDKTTQGDCRPSKDCPVDDAVLRCDDDTDCPRDPKSDAPGVCALSTTVADLYNPVHASIAQCRFATQESIQSAAALALCQERQACADSAFPCVASTGDPNPLPGYFWCRCVFPTPGSSTPTGAGGADGGQSSDVPSSGLQVWLSADQGTTLNGMSVSAWADQSGNHRNATQGVAKSQPVLDPTALGGKPGLVFDGFEQWMYLPAFDFDVTAGLSIFMVVQVAEQTDEFQTFFSASNGSNTQDIELGNWKQAIVYDVAASYVNDVRFPVPVGTPQIVGAVQQMSGEARISLDGIAAGTDNIPLPEQVERRNVFIGRSLRADFFTHHGVISEVLIYNRALDEAETAAIVAHLQQHWACCGG